MQRVYTTTVFVYCCCGHVISFIHWSGPFPRNIQSTAAIHLGWDTSPLQCSHSLTPVGAIYSSQLWCGKNCDVVSLPTAPPEHMLNRKAYIIITRCITLIATQHNKSLSQFIWSLTFPCQVMALFSQSFKSAFVISTRAFSPDNISSHSL